MGQSFAVCTLQDEHYELLALLISTSPKKPAQNTAHQVQNLLLKTDPPFLLQLAGILNVLGYVLLVDYLKAETLK